MQHDGIHLENRLSSNERIDPQQKTTDLGQPASFASRFAARHNKIGNLDFADGHAGGFKGSRAAQTTPGSGEGGAILPHLDIVWTPDPNYTLNESVIFQRPLILQKFKRIA